MWRRLEEKRYWIAYYLAYPISVIILAALSGPRTIAEWAAIVALSAGIATGLVILVEVIGRVVLLIPSTIRKLRQEGRAAGIEESNAQWKAWLARKEAAEEPFNEPSPADQALRMLLGQESGSHRLPSLITPAPSSEISRPETPPPLASACHTRSARCDTGK